METRPVKTVSGNDASAMPLGLNKRSGIQDSNCLNALTPNLLYDQRRVADRDGVTSFGNVSEYPVDISTDGVCIDGLKLQMQQFFNIVDREARIQYDLRV